MKRQPLPGSARCRPIWWQQRHCSVNIVPLTSPAPCAAALLTASFRSETAISAAQTNGTSPEHHNAGDWSAGRRDARVQSILLRFVAAQHRHAIHDHLITPKHNTFTDLHRRSTVSRLQELNSGQTRGSIRVCCTHKVLLVREPCCVVFRYGFAGAETGEISVVVEHRTPVFYGSAWPKCHTHVEAASLNGSLQRENFTVIMPTTCWRECARVAV